MPEGMLDDAAVKECLLGGQYVDAADMQAAETEAARTRQALVNVLLAKQLITKDILGQAMAERLGVAYADLNSHRPSKDQVQKIPAEVGQKFRVVLFADKNGELIFATDKVDQAGMGQALQGVFPKAKKATVAYSLPEDIDAALKHYRTELKTRFGKILQAEGAAAPKLIDEIFKDALTLNASDIHFEPQAEEVAIRFRIDDVLAETGRIPKTAYEMVLNRIKVMAQLRTDEHFAAQDGAIHWEGGGEAVDMRVSIAPIVDGEKIALRLLSRYVQEFTLGNLGLGESDQKIIRQASQLPFGMVLTTGPTGSGKTTTLYSVVKILNDPKVNITTIEDPVEYKIPGVNHIQVNEQTELTFAKGLRSIVRQDPDIVLVGEIRDDETADIAVNAALTGHLLFSTFHANDAATAIPRLLDMGVEPFLLASTLEVVIAQRLVRKLSEEDRVSYSITKGELAEKYPEAAPYFEGETITLYKGKEGAAAEGYKGRVAIFELIKITPELEQLMLKNPSSQEVWQLARRQGAKSMFEDGIEKVKHGVTTIEEVLRVAQAPRDVSPT